MNWLTINELKYDLTGIDLEMPLIWFIRDEAKLKGSKYSCGKGLCGACSVLIDEQSSRACITPVKSVINKNITTIEALATPLKEAFIQQNVPQCGYCQTGQIISAASLLKQQPNANKEQIRQHMSGNICRCGTYSRIEAAIISVQQAENLAINVGDKA